MTPKKDGGNWYLYAGSDPVNAWDPWGLAEQYINGEYRGTHKNGLYLEAENKEGINKLQKALEEIEETGIGAALVTSLINLTSNKQKKKEMRIRHVEHGKANFATPVDSSWGVSSSTSFLLNPSVSISEYGLAKYRVEKRNKRTNKKTYAYQPHESGGVSRVLVVVNDAENEWNHPLAIKLAHELTHAYDFLSGMFMDYRPYMPERQKSAKLVYKAKYWDQIGEVKAVMIGNIMLNQARDKDPDAYEGVMVRKHYRTVSQREDIISKSGVYGHEKENIPGQLEFPWWAYTDNIHLNLKDIDKGILEYGTFAKKMKKVKPAKYISDEVRDNIFTKSSVPEPSSDY